MSIDKDLSDRPMEGRAPGGSFGKEGVPADLAKAMAKPALRVALDEHLAEALPEDAKPAIETAQRVQPEDGHDRER